MLADIVLNKDGLPPVKYRSPHSKKSRSTYTSCEMWLEGIGVAVLLLEHQRIAETIS